MSTNYNISRRNACKHGLAFAAVLAAGCESDTLKSKDSGTNDLSLADISELQNVGGVYRVSIPEINKGKELLVIRHDTASFAVLSTVCTHQGCPVGTPATADDDIMCPCHQSVFSPVDGHVISGPATASLSSFTATYDPYTDTVSIKG